MIVFDSTTGQLGIALVVALVLATVTARLLRVRVCVWDGRRIVGLAHTFHGRPFCSHRCAAAWAVKRVRDGLAEPDLPTLAGRTGL